MNFGYARVSTEDQSLDLQLDALARVQCDEIITEKVSSRTKERPTWNALRNKLRSGDVVIVYKLDRISRNTRELLTIMDDFAAVCVHIKSLQEPWLDTQSPTGKIIFTVMAGIAEFERELIKERTSAGRRAALKRGVKFGRPMKIDAMQAKLIAGALKNGTAVRDVAEAFGVSVDTIYRLRKVHQD